MKRNEVVTSVIAGLILGVLVLATGSPLLGSETASAQLPVADVVTLMRNSHEKWSSVSLDAVTVWHVDGESQTVTMSVQIQQPNQSRISIYQVDNKGNVLVDYLWVTDGKIIYEQNNLSKKYTEHPVPDFAKLPLDDLVKSASVLGEPVIIRHPMAMIMPSPLSDYLFPTGLSQRIGVYTLEKDDMLENRKSVVVNWRNNRNNNSDGGWAQSRYWVDTDTGIILKAITYGENNVVFEEMTITNLTLDAGIPSNAYVFQPPLDYEFIPYAEFTAFGQ